LHKFCRESHPADVKIDLQIRMEIEPIAIAIPEVCAVRLHGRASGCQVAV
jgi:hypothetical protein